ncbi:MAG: lipid-A-disaccharide synthase [Armatimonadota bacterium]
MAGSPKKVFIVAGELSGDLLAGALASEIRRRRPSWRLVGAGGPHLRSAGVHLLYDSTSWGAIGFTQSVRLIPKLSLTLASLKSYIAQHQPHRVVLVDFGTFNVRVARFAKKHGVTVCYYVPPGSWKRGRANPELARIADLILTPFPWSAEELRLHGANAHWTGHPLLDIVRPSRSREEVLCEVGLADAQTVFGLLPGSRKPELLVLAPLMARTAVIIQGRCQNAGFLLAAAPTTDLHKLDRLVRSSGWVPIDSFVSAGGVLRYRVGSAPAAVVQGASYDVMAASDMLLCCSGTATLEAAILGKPMVIAYKTHGIAQAVEYALGHRLLPRYIGLPNLLANAEVCPELIQRQANPENLAWEALDILRTEDRLLDMLRGLREVRSALGHPGASARAAELICDPNLGRAK